MLFFSRTGAQVGEFRLELAQGAGQHGSLATCDSCEQGEGMLRGPGAGVLSQRDKSLQGCVE